MTKTTERHQALLHMLNARGYATIDELTKCFSVTPQTIRKDINTLAGQGKVQRFHGGVGMPLSTENILYEQRKKLFLPEKKAIAQMLAKHIPDGASICINLGTTTEEVAYALLGHNNLRVLTNNLNVAAIMARNPNFDVVVAGGTVQHHDHGIIGPSAAAHAPGSRDGTVSGLAASRIWAAKRQIFSATAPSHGLPNCLETAFARRPAKKQLPGRAFSPVPRQRTHCREIWPDASERPCSVPPKMVTKKPRRFRR